MADYKEILRSKAGNLRRMLAINKDKMDYEKYTNWMILVNNTIEITNGRLDALDYDVRNQSIMSYHSRLDSAISELNRMFGEQEQGKEDYK